MKNKISGILEIEDGDDIKCFQCVFERPKLEVESIQIDYYTTSRLMQGRVKWNNVKISFYNHEYPFEEGLSTIHRWVRTYSDTVTGRMGAPLKRNITLKETDLSGYVIANWQITGAIIRNFNTDIIYDYGSERLFSFAEKMSYCLTRRVLFEKNNNPTLQIITELELIVDNVLLT